MDADRLGDDGPDALMLMRLLRARSVVSGPGDHGGPGFSAAAAAAAAEVILDDDDE